MRFRAGLAAPLVCAIAAAAGCSGKGEPAAGVPLCEQFCEQEAASNDLTAEEAGCTAFCDGAIPASGCSSQLNALLRCAPNAGSCECPGGPPGCEDENSAYYTCIEAYCGAPPKPAGC